MKKWSLYACLADHLVHSPACRIVDVESAAAAAAAFPTTSKVSHVLFSHRSIALNESLKIAQLLPLTTVLTRSCSAATDACHTV
jgi:hypothetical protein